MPTNNDEKITLGLDIPKTTRQINADMKKVQSQLTPINIKADIDTSGMQKSGQKAGQDFADAAQKAVDLLIKSWTKISAENIFNTKNLG